jgi:hypothetical protein
MCATFSSGSLFPSTEYKVQSQYFYLQSVGSTNADGSTYGAHVRWMLTSNLGDLHMPKGDYASTTANFNRKGDYVALLRSRYNEPIRTIINFSTRPDFVQDNDALWVYVTTDLPTTVYIHFRDVARYQAVRSVVDPSLQPQEFIRQYSPALIEAELPDKLFFAAEIHVQRNATTTMRAEALSVESNVPLSPLFVSCRRTFTDDTWCPPDPGAGGNLLINGGFEPDTGYPLFAFETDYKTQQGAGAGILNVVEDAHTVNGGWVGRPHSGKSFLAVDGRTIAGDVLRTTVPVRSSTLYTFSGWLATLYSKDVSIPLEFRIAAGGAVQKFQKSTPAQAGVWEPFTFQWQSGNAIDHAVVSIVSLSTLSVGNDFAIDDLSFSEAPRKDCNARLMSENIRSIRFDITNGYPQTIAFETYEDYIARSHWQSLDDKLALTTNDDTAWNRVVQVPGTVDANWLKFNDGALLNASNYANRWGRQDGGLKQGVEKYIALSDSASNPTAVDMLPGEQAEDGQIKVTILEALQLVSLDFHVARMLGLGYLNANIEGDRTAYIYLGIYDTEGPLNDGGGARLVRHFYMGVPTRPIDHRLPPIPRLQPVTYGLTVDNGEQNPPSLTDADGYTPDGQSRFINLFVEHDSDSASLMPFFVPPDEFCAIDHTTSVFYGIEYRKQGEAAWRNPEIAHDQQYSDLAGIPEPLPLPNNANSALPIFRHEEQENGVHEYAPYGINWYSRVSSIGNVVVTDATVIAKAARLLPPANFAVQLIERESPLILTTSAEQLTLGGLSGDKTLVRVTFDYDQVQDINYGFADSVELYFRSEMPRNVTGALLSVTDDASDFRKAVLHTTGYAVNSLGATIEPVLSPGLYQNFAGGTLTCDQESYVITGVSAPGGGGEGPVFTFRKNIKGNASDPGGTGAHLTVQDYIAPHLPSSGQVMFMAVENMAEIASWDTPNPLTTTVSLSPAATQHQESYNQDGKWRTLTLRGIWEQTQVIALGNGLYQIEFASTLAHHPQSADPNPVDWYKGSVRIGKAGSPNEAKKVLDVQIVQHIGDGLPLVLHALDDDPANAVETGPSVWVNYYPGYRLYLHAMPGNHFDSTTIQPAAGEGTRRTWLGARAVDTVQHYESPVGIPAPIVAVELHEPFAPGRPRGADYATWPDYYFKSSYTFLLSFTHEPYSVALYRANETAILRALYSDATYDAVKTQLDLLGEDDPDRARRWRNLLGFDYIYDVPTPDHVDYDPTGFSANGTFRKFPATPGGYAFPNPDRPGVFTGANPGTVLPALREAVTGAFTALTELPLIYQFIKGPNYQPVPKSQNIRNSQGKLLDPADREFDLAPMARRTANPNEIEFTDFTLDGTGVNLFFYLGREIGNRGRLGDPGPIAGPVQLINTRPPDAPAVRRMYVREPDFLNGRGPSIQFEINAFPEVQKVRRMLIYRTTDAQEALSVRTMALVKTVDLDPAAQMAVSLADDFESGFIPYGDPMYYRIVALRKVKKADGGTDWAPSQPSKLLLTTMIDTVNPPAPEVTYTSEGLSGTPAVMTNVALSWQPTAYNGTYYLEKMTSSGVWRSIYEISTNAAVTVDLAATDLATAVLPKESEDDGRTIYNRFHVRVRNSSGLFNLDDQVLTI